MPDDSPPLPVVVFELSLLIVGLVLLWRLVLSPAARARLRATPVQLAPWTVSIRDFFLCAALIAAAGLAASFVANLLFAPFDLSTDAKTIINSAAFQLGLLLGPAFAPLELGHPPLRPPLPRSVILSGLVTFLIALPVVTVVNLLSLYLLDLAGLPAQQQDLLRLFAEADSSALLVVMIALAVLVAPMAEELLFRATFFRFLRTRVPRFIALLLPGTIFAALHVNWSSYDGLASFLPLITLAVIFSLAYERTGRIATAMIAHALFNLHTLLLLFAGVSSA
jgi:CAAX amino terminal protease family.